MKYYRVSEEQLNNLSEAVKSGGKCLCEATELIEFMWATFIKHSDCIGALHDEGCIDGRIYRELSEDNPDWEHIRDTMDELGIKR